MMLNYEGRLCYYNDDMSSNSQPGRPVKYGKVPVRYRPNAASGGRSYGRDLIHMKAIHPVPAVISSH